MFMFSINKQSNGKLQELKLTKSDTAKFEVDIVDPVSFQPYIIQTGDKVEFSVKKFFTDRVPLFTIKGIPQSNSNRVVFTISPSDTLNMALGKYLCSVKLTLSTGGVHTIVAPTCRNLNEYIPNFYLCGGEE